jgi:dephospho-CoA kinase
MKLLGVTGGIGMGKSTCAGLLAAMGVPVVDTDDLARELARPGQPALTEIAGAFGAGLIGSDGELRRGELARIVFGSEADRKTLEGILHPRIREEWLRTAGIWREEGRAIGAVIIPLLFETHAEQDVDATICVACSERSQMERLASRKWSGEEIARRVAAQMPVRAKMARANYVIWSEGSIETHRAQLERVLGGF